MSKARDIADLDFNSPDIDGGNIDGATIGGTTPAAGSFSGLTVDTMTLNASSITGTSNLTLDVSGNINLDADGGSVFFKDAGIEFFKIRNTGSDVQIYSARPDADIKFEGVDGSVGITALRLDMSDGGAAHFINDIYIKDNQAIRFGDDQDFRIFNDSNHTTFQNSVSNQDMLFKGNDGGSLITALQLDMSESGKATFNSGIKTGNNGYINIPTASSGNANISFDGSDFNITSNSSSANMNFQTSSQTRMTLGAVSYTHLTLPTIYSV